MLGVSLETHTAAEGSPLTDTRRMLLAAATSVFAERGFREATIREICQRAGANIAAVNYHFRDKEGLYEEVIKACRDDARNPEIHLSMDSSTPAPVRLEAYVRWMFRRVLAFDVEFPMGQIMSREMVEPTQALERVVEVHIRPEALWLGGVMRDLLGPRFDREELARATMSVVGQLLFYKHCGPVIRLLDPKVMPSHDTFEVHVRHITDFTLAALAGLRAHREAESSLTSGPFDSTDTLPFAGASNPR